MPINGYKHTDEHNIRISDGKRIQFIPLHGGKDCILWTGTVNNKGYGKVGYRGKDWTAHRLSYALNNPGVDIGKRLVLHTCDVRNCINPDHLFLGTHTDNMRDMVSKGRHVSHTKGKPRTPEDKEKISLANKGKFVSEERKQKIKESVLKMYKLKKEKK